MQAVLLCRCSPRRWSHARPRASRLGAAPHTAQTALPESCSFLRKDFGYPMFDYEALWTSNTTVPTYCTLE